MVRYVKCPRCDLNYIDGDKQEYCDVCLAEMRGSKLQFADLDEDEYDELEVGGELCPICGVNTMRYGETMCEACRKEREEYNEEDEEVDIDKDEEWKNYLDEDESDDLTVDDEVAEELEEEFGEDEEDEEEFYDGEDPLDEDLDELGDFDDDDDDDDDEDEDDDLF